MAFMDKEHHEILLEINRALESYDFAEVGDEGIDTFFAFEGRILMHCSHEELLMRQYNYPELEKHVLEHTVLIDLIRRFKHDYFKMDREDLALEYDIESFKRYFKNHILKEDLKLVEYVKQKGTSKGNFAG
jgi:hemerythrin-like metal-binding protein